MHRRRPLLRSRIAWIALALVALNEIRGLCVVAGVLLTARGRIF